MNPAQPPSPSPTPAVAPGGVQQPQPTAEGAINYQPLQAMGRARQATARKMFLSKNVVWLLVALLMTWGLAIDSSEYVIGPLALYLILVSVWFQSYKNNVWKKFAQANNWRCTDGGGDLPPSLHFGANYTFTPSIEMDMGNGLVCQLFGCSWDEEYSRGALGRIDRALGGHRTLTSHYYTVASVRLQQDLPHIMLRNKTSKVKDRTEMTNATDLQLEGDFNKYFKLQIEKGQQVDALQVLTPDVMQTLLTYSSREDIELSGKLLSFIIGGDKRDAADVQALIRSVFALTTQIMENLRLAGSLPPPQNITAKS